ncbi:MAG TPA: fumarylacetoacetate hydrolase family protein [Novosphingobium sp.]|nr:fumarylacetoacetate hydrolase family protein [Novosphingobium sp.]
MKILSYAVGGKSSFGLLVEGGVVDLAERLGVSTLKAALASNLLGRAAAFAQEPADHPLEGITFLPVVPDPAHIWCMAINYQDHIDEIKAVGINRDVPKEPALFMRYPDSLIGHLQPILKPRESNELDWEAELAVIIGKGGSRISEENALDHVAGYTAFNDGSVRDWQFHTRQIAPGKNFRATGSLGPWMVTADVFGDPGDVPVKTRLNGETLQDSSTRYFIHNIPKMIAYVSTILDLQPGDVIATGTPSGVGFSRKPPIFMKEGDTVEVEIGGVGVLINPIELD